jgi:hypothetical protein
VEKDPIFFSLVEKQPAHEGGHWIWKGHAMRHASSGGDTLIPYFTLTKRQRGFAHRYAWELTFGVALGSGHIYRICPESLCINPDHWRYGHRPKGKKLERAQQQLPERDRRLRLTEGPGATELAQWLHRYELAAEKQVKLTRDAWKAVGELRAAMRELLPVLTSIASRPVADSVDPDAVAEAVVVRLGPRRARDAEPEPDPEVPPATGGSYGALARAFVGAVGLPEAMATIINPGPLGEALDLALESSLGDAQKAVERFNVWLGAYAENRTKDSEATAAGFLAYVRHLAVESNRQLLGAHNAHDGGEPPGQAVGDADAPSDPDALPEHRVDEPIG